MFRPILVFAECFKSFIRLDLARTHRLSGAIRSNSGDNHFDCANHQRPCAIASAGRSAKRDDQERCECDRPGESEHESDPKLYRSLPDVRCGLLQLCFGECDLLTQEIAGVVTESLEQLSK